MLVNRDWGMSSLFILWEWEFRYFILSSSHDALIPASLCFWPCSVRQDPCAEKQRLLNRTVAALRSGHCLSSSLPLTALLLVCLRDQDKNSPVIAFTYKPLQSLKYILHPYRVHQGEPVRCKHYQQMEIKEIQQSSFCIQQ